MWLASRDCAPPHPATTTAVARIEAKAIARVVRIADIPGLFNQMGSGTVGKVRDEGITDTAPKQPQAERRLPLRSGAEECTPRNRNQRHAENHSWHQSLE